MRKWSKAPRVLALLAALVAAAVGFAPASAYAGAEVAKVGETSYSSLQEAIEAAEQEPSGATVEVLGDVSLANDESLLIKKTGANVVLDLKGHTVSMNDDDTISIQDGDNIKLVVKNGTIVNSHAKSYGLYVYGVKDGQRTTSDNIDVTFESLNLKTVDQAIGVNGTNTNNNVTLLNCVIECETTAVYWPPISGLLTIEDTSIVARDGVTIKGGSVVVKGNTHIKATGEKKIPEEYYDGNPAGTLTSTGAAVYVESGYNGRDIKLDIQDGTFDSENGEAVLYFVKKDETVTVAREIGVEGGSFSKEVPAKFIKENSAMLVGEDGRAAVMSSAEAEAKAGAAVVKDGKTVYYTSEKAATDANPGSGDVTVYVASVDGKKYETVAAAIQDADGKTVVLVNDVQEDIVIPEGKSVTLDLAGYKLTNKSGHTIVNKGALVLKDSSEGATGVVDNTSHEKAALVVEEGASAEINGGTLRRSKEAGTAKGNNGNSYYTVLNKGKLEINDGATVELLLSDGKPAAYSSVIANGWYSGAPTAEGYNATLTINGGTIKGGKYVKNDSYGTMIVNGGKIVDGAEASVLNWNVATINGGTFDPSADAAGAIFNVKAGAPEKGSLVVSGGTFVTTGDQPVVFTSNDENKSEDAAISGGTFQGNPPADEYVVPGSGLVKDENGNYVTVDAKIVYASDKIVDGVFTYDVKGGDAEPITEADLLALVTMNVEGYKLSVDASALPALNKAIGAADTSAEFKFAFSAVKDGAATRAVSDVEPLVVTVKLSDSTVEPAPEPSQKVTVTFETGLGSSFTKEVEAGSKLERPADPAREGWKFVGWFTKKASDGTVSDEWNFEKGVVEGDMTLYGGWVKVGSDGTGSEAKPGSALPQTGDASMLPILAAGGAGVAAVAAGALISKRRKAE